MTPSGWTLNSIALAGFAWTFGGLLLAAGLGALVGRRRGITAGLGSALLLWALGNLLTVALTLLYWHVDTTVMALPVQHCEAATDHRERQVFFALPDGRRVQMQAGSCPEAPPPEPLRLRKDDLASARNPLTADWAADTDKPVAMAVTWGGFGGIALLMALVLLGPTPQTPRAGHASHQRDGNRRGQASGTPAPQAVQATSAVAAWRLTIAEIIGGLGLLLFLAAFIAPFFLSGSTERGIQFGMRCVAMAMACWFLSGLLAGSLQWTAALFLLFFGGAMAGIAQLL